MVETIIFHHPTNHIHHHHHLSLLTLCGKRVKQSQTVRSGRFESNLLIWPGRPNTHAWGSTSRFTHAIFPSIPAARNRPTTLDYKNPRHGTTPGREPSCTRMWPHENNVQRRWGVCSGLGAIQYLSLPITIFLGMWLVRSKA